MQNTYRKQPNKNLTRKPSKSPPVNLQAATTPKGSVILTFDHKPKKLQNGPQIAHPIFAKQFSGITEISNDNSSKSNFSLYERRLLEISALRIESDTLNIIEMPSQSSYGCFEIKILPNCGSEPAFCSIMLKVKYGIKETDIEYLIEDGGADGLSTDMLDELRDCILMQAQTNSNVYDVIQLLRDQLGVLNPDTKNALNYKKKLQQQQENFQRQQTNEREKEKALKEQALLQAEFEKNLMQQLNEDKLWRETIKIADATKMVESIVQAVEKHEPLPQKQTEAIPLESLQSISRYSVDFEEICKIAEGGFGQVFKAQHRIDGNIYAIKKIKLESKPDSVENKRIRREVTYLSALNNPYIVRYFQTWVETETDPKKIAEFEDSEEEYDSETDSEEEEYTEIQDRKKNSSSLGRKKNFTPGGPPAFQGLQAEDNIDSPMRGRANTDWQQSKFKGLALRKTGNRLETTESEVESEYMLNHDQQSEFEMSPFNHGLQSRMESEKPSMSSRSSPNPGIKILYIQMQYCEGESLQHFLQKNPETKQSAIKWKIFRQILEALAYLHTRGIIHRDIKPQNIFLDENKDAKMGDFGLAIKYTPQTTGKNTSGLELNLTKNKSMTFDSLTTGLGTVRFAAPEQLLGGKKKGAPSYGYQVDMYSLGVVLLDMFRNHDISGRELQEIHEAMLSGVVEPNLAKKMPLNAVQLVQNLTKKNPSQRPTVFEVLQSELVPQDEVFQKLQVHLKNPKNSAKQQLMHFLVNQAVPKSLDLTYFGDYDYTNAQTLQLQKQQMQTKARGILYGDQKRRVRDKNRKLGIIEKNLAQEIQSLFELQGATQLIDLPVMGPKQDSLMILISKRVAQYENCQMKVNQDGLIVPQFEFKVQSKSQWQEVILPQEQKRSTFNVLDEAGLVLSFNQDLVKALARRIAKQKTQVYRKLFTIGQTFRLQASQSKQNDTFYKIAMGPTPALEACYAIISPKTQNLMNETECIRLCDQVLKSKFQNQTYLIHISSSEILDCIFEECLIPIQDRLKTIHSYNQDECSNQHFRELVKIKGSLEQVEAQIQAKTHKFKQRFLSVIADLRALKESLKFFDLVEFNAEATARQRTVVIFDFGVQLSGNGLWSGLVFKVGLKFDDLRTNQKAIRGNGLLAYGGRFDNLVGHYQLNIQKYLPQSVCCSFLIREIAQQLIDAQTNDCKIDVCIFGPKEMIQEKIRLLQELQVHKIRVHVDFGDIMDQQSIEFMEQNNVHIVVLLNNDIGGVLTQDRFTDTHQKVLLPKLVKHLCQLVKA